MSRLNQRADTRFRCTLFITMTVTAALGHAAQPLDVDDAAGPEAPGGKWKQARLIYGEDFESQLDGAYPGKWRSSRETMVRRTRSGGQVLLLERHGQVRFKRKLTGGHLRIQFDLHQQGKPVSINLGDLRPPADVGWGPFSEIGPALILDAAGRLTWNRRVGQESHAIGMLAPGQWHRVLIVADLAENTFDIFSGGKVVGAGLPFYDQRWVRGVDWVGFDSKQMLLDNLTVHHLPGRSRSKAQGYPPPPHMPAPRLETAPTFDGKVDEAAWKDAYRTETFHLLRGGPSNDPRTAVWLGHDGQFLYIATRLWPHDMESTRRRAAVKLRETLGSTFWDCIEIFIDVSGGEVPDRYLHLSYHEGGKGGQEIGRGQLFRGRWDLKTAMGDDHWDAEIRIPLVELGAICPPSGTWGLNVCRGKGVGPQRAALSPTFGGFHSPKRFVRITDLDPDEIFPLRCELGVPEPILTRGATINVSLRGPAVKVGSRFICDVTATHWDGSQVHETTTIKVGNQSGTQRVPMKLPLVKAGEYFIQAKIRPENWDKVLPLAITPPTYAIVHERGSLQTRTDYNYYTSEAVVKVRCTLLGTHVPDGSRASVAIPRPDGDPLQLADMPVGASPFVVEFPLRPVPLGEHEATVTLSMPEQEKAVKVTFPLVRRRAKHNEVKIRWDNVLIVHGEPFFPIFVWHTDILRAVDLGANSARVEVGSLNEHRLQLAQRAGIHLIAYPRGNWDGRIEGMKDHPLLLSWFIEDEPGHDNAQPNSDMIELTELTRKLDPYHPTYANVMPGWGFMRAYANVFDTWGATTYASGFGYSQSFVRDTTRLALHLSQNARPFWPTLQAFYFKYNRNHPTPTEFRHSMYSAIVHGATGLSLWGIGDTPGFNDEDIRGALAVQTLWHAAKKVIRELRSITSVIVSDEQVPVTATCENENVVLMRRSETGRMHVFLLNMSKTRQKASLVLGRERGRLVNQIEPVGTAWEIAAGRCEVDLEPLQPLVLRLENGP